MTKRSATSRTLSTNSLFAIFFLTLCGWGLLHAWGLAAKAGVLVHLLFSIPGLILSSLTLYRYRRHWPAAGPRRARQPYRASAVFLLLAAAGCALGLLAARGSFFSLALALVAIVLVPWARIPACRDHFLAASILMACGVPAGMLMLGDRVHPLHYAAAAWLSLALAGIALISVIFTHRNRFERMPVSGYAEDCTLFT